MDFFLNHGMARKSRNWVDGTELGFGGWGD